MSASSYYYDITFNKILGDMEIVDMGDEISYEYKCARKSFYCGEISRMEYEIFTEAVTDFFIEFVEIRRNEFEKWFGY